MYAKLFSSITESSLWSEPKEVRLLFVTMLAKADRIGFVEASVPGLARVANLTIDETQYAIDVLSKPDPYSKNPDHEGRRIVAAPGGFMLLNYEEYRSRRNTEERQEYMRNYMQNYRKQCKQHVNKSKPPLNAVNRGEPWLAHADADADADAETKKEKEEKPSLSFVKEKQEQKTQATEANDRFTFLSGPDEWVKEFYGTYPKKVEFNAVSAALYGEIAVIVGERGVTDQAAFDLLLSKAKRYCDSQFVKTSPRTGIPSPALWLTKGRWRDDPAEWDINANGSKPSTGKPVIKPIPDAKPKRNLGNDLMGELMR